MRALFLSLCLALAWPAMAQAQTEPGVFTNYQQMRGTLDALMQNRNIAQLLTAFGGADEMSQQEMASLEQQVRAIFPQNFTQSALMIRQAMENGFRQELIAYWDDDYNYIYARLLLHERPDGQAVAINMTFNSDVDTIIPLF